MLNNIIHLDIFTNYKLIFGLSYQEEPFLYTVILKKKNIQKYLMKTIKGQLYLNLFLLKIVISKKKYIYQMI